MDRFKIHGGRKLEGTVRISGAKNASLPAMAAALLTADPVRLQNIPHVRDIITMAKLLAHMRCRVESPDLPPSEFTIQAQTVSHQEAPYELVKTMRASVLTLGPLVARFGYAHVSLPGGCSIGARPIDLHIQALEKLGAQITVEHGYVEARATRLRGTAFRFPKITVTGTENILTAAVLAEGETVLENCALEPEVTDLVELLDQDGRKNRRRWNIHASHSRRRSPARRHTHRNSRPHRGRHVSDRRRHHGWRASAHKLRAEAPYSRDRQAQGMRNRHSVRGTETSCVCARQRN